MSSVRSTFSGIPGGGRNAARGGARGAMAAQPLQPCSEVFGWEVVTTALDFRREHAPPHGKSPPVCVAWPPSTIVYSLTLGRYVSDAVHHQGCY